MPLSISFELSDRDLEHFHAVMEAARAAEERTRNRVSASVRRAISSAPATDPALMVE